MKRLFVLLLLAAFLCSCAAEPIGSIRGPEFDEIIIDGTVYVRDSGDEFQSFSSADKGELLGTVTNGDEFFQVYTVKGDAEQIFLYARWDWEGDFYVRKDIRQAE